MGRKDIAGKAFFSDYERFAELMNVHLYCGRKILIPENLQRIERSYPALAGAYGEKNRDILMEDIGQKIHIGMELETESDYSMPERVMVYDACEYEQQIRQIHRRHRQDGDYAAYREKKSRMKKEDCLCRTVTLVMYLGEGHWEGKRRLSEMLYPSGQNTVFMMEDWQDYSFILLEADFVNPADYKTDLREFFQAMQYRRDRKKLRDLLRSEAFKNLKPETELAIAVHLGTKRLVHKMGKEEFSMELSMCKAFEEILQEEKQCGRREGKREGRKEERKVIINRMKAAGIADDLISSIMDYAGDGIVM